MVDKVFIFCDDPAHPRRQVAVTNFYRVASGQDRRQAWSEIPDSSFLLSGTNLVDDVPTTSATVVDAVTDAIDNRRDLRYRIRLECRKCGNRTVVVARQEGLFSALDSIADNGESGSSLRDLAAKLKSTT
jgi:hypothetical protein